MKIDLPWRNNKKGTQQLQFGWPLIDLKETRICEEVIAENVSKYDITILVANQQNATQPWSLVRPDSTSHFAQSAPGGCQQVLESKEC